MYTVFFISLLYILFRSRPFQNWAAQKAITYLSSELETKVRLDKIDIELLNTLVLKGLYIEDKQGDTLGYFETLKIDFNYKILFNNNLQLAKVKKVVFENSIINFTQHQGQDDFNYEFLIDYFDPPRTTPRIGPRVPFKLILNNLEFKNVNFRLKIEGEDPVIGRRFNESDMSFQNIHAVITPFKIVDDSLNFNIRHMSFKEKSGFHVVDFYAKTIISGTEMSFEDMLLTTPNSQIGNYLKFTYSSYNELSDFVEKVQWNSTLKESKVNAKDIAYFTDELIGQSFPVSLDGKVTGSLVNLFGKGMKIKIGELNSFKGDMELIDLTNTEKLSFKLKNSPLYLNPSSIQQIFNIELPVELLRIGSIKYMGDLKGKLNDFSIDGLLETTIGKIKTDLNLKFPDNAPEEYKGDIEIYAFNTGKLLNTSELGLLTMTAKVDGKGFNIEQLNTMLQGHIESFGYDDYTYQDISMDGIFDKKLFTGFVDFKDPNLNFNIKGMFDLNKYMPIGDFNAQVNGINLVKLGYGDINIKQISNLAIKFEGKDVDNIVANATITNLVLEKKDTVYRLGNIYLDAYGPEEKRSITFRSDLGNISIAGKYRLSYLKSISNNLLYNLFPDYYPQLKEKTEPVDVRFDIDIQSSRYISALFLPEINFQEFTASGVYNSVSQNLDIISRAKVFNYLEYGFKEVELESNKKPGERLSLSTNVSKFLISDSLITDKLNLTADIGGNDIHYLLNVSDTTHDLSLIAGGEIIFKKSNIDFTFKNSVLSIYNKPWYIENNNHFNYSDSKLKIDSFRVYNNLQSIALNGSIDETNFDDLSLNLTKFELAEINPILKKWGVQMAGKLDGDLFLKGLQKKPLVDATLDINNFVFDSDTIGDIHLVSSIAKGPYTMGIVGTIKNGLINKLDVSGNIDIASKDNNLDLVFTLEKTNIKPFEVFTEGLFSNITGVADAQLMVKGSFSNPDIKGMIDLPYGSLYMDYLGLPIKFNNAKIKIDERRINLGNFEIYDKNGAQAFAGGSIYHKNFDDLRFDIYLKDLKNFQCMDLVEYQNEMFWGKAFIDGNVTVKGPIDEINLNINAKTRPKTVISIPLSGTSENTGPDYIQIIDLRADVGAPQLKKLSGINMNFNFDITEDAELKLIFDAKFDDVIRATGKGNITMELNTYGDFYMYGKYTIYTGSYNFTALNNLVNTNLKVRSGSEISWNGQPLDAQVDLIATTTVMADPTVILPASTSSYGATNNVAVECAIHMTEKLFSPALKLDIGLDKENNTGLFANSELTNAINQIKSNQDETNKQFINLLVFNSFAPLNSGGNTATSNQALSSFQNSIGEFMTNQLNSWLSQIDPRWELGIDFQNTGNSESNQQVIVRLKRKLYNDRLEIGGTYGQAGNSSYDVNLSYKIKKDGRLLIRTFDKRGNDPINPNGNTINTSGLGLYYRKDIDFFFPDWRKKRHDKKMLEQQNQSTN